MAAAEQDGAHPSRVDATLVVGGRFHDFDHARLQLLGLLAEHEDVRTAVAADYEDVPLGDLLVSYTCDVRPSEAAQARIAPGSRAEAVVRPPRHEQRPRLHAQGVASPRVFPRGPRRSGASS
jgi:hypothetical protein